MTSRERMLSAHENGRPDRLPCQVHGWMPYYLKKYLGGMDEPQTLHHILEAIVKKTLHVTEMWEHTAADMVEVGGGAGSSTVIGPDFYREFGLSYDQRQNKFFFIGGFDQNAGFERGTPKEVRRLVFECFEATKDHAGYILCPSDHFFHGDPACLHAFAEAARECVY